STAPPVRRAWPPFWRRRRSGTPSGCNTAGAELSVPRSRGRSSVASSQQKVLASHPDDTGTPELGLVRLDRDTFEVALLRWAAPRLRPAPGQRRLATGGGHPPPRAATGPYRTPCAVGLADIEVHDRVTALEACVGFGILDRLGILRDLTQTPESSVLLRAY